VNKETTGWVIFISAVGMMSGLISVDIATLPNWDQATSPAFVGLIMARLATVIMAFVGGKIIPTDRNPAERTRVEDQKIDERVIKP